MNPINHPLTEARTAELWDRTLRHLVAFEWEVEWEDMNTEEMVHALIAMRAAFDAGREYEREHTDPHRDPRPWQDCTVKDIREGDLVEAQIEDRLDIGVAHRQDEDGNWWTKDDRILTWGDRWPLRRIPALTTEKEPTMTETTAEPSARTLLGIPDTHGTPHHNVYAIRPGDFVVEVDKGGAVSGGVVHYQDADDDWFDENGTNVTWAAARAARPDAVTVWPAPTPPAEEVELPSEPGSVLHDVSLTRSNGTTAHADAAMLDDEGYWQGRWDGEEESTFEGYPTEYVHACTLPDGTRARRDGERPDGTPRFVKVQEEQK